MGGIIPSVSIVRGKLYRLTLLQRFLWIRKRNLTTRSFTKLWTTSRRLRGGSLSRLVILLNMYSPCTLCWEQAHLVVLVLWPVERCLQTLIPSTHARIGSLGSLSRNWSSCRTSIGWNIYLVGPPKMRDRIFPLLAIWPLVRLSWRPKCFSPFNPSLTKSLSFLIQSHSNSPQTLIA